ncbi:MAG TPA: hypothetical protein VMS31_08665, partial [Pyrinomonadaceae bacterium]|nr:hypothetical protein [Pyrinomonadaceae bacterium]
RALNTALESKVMFSRLGALDHEWLALLLAARASLSAGQTQDGLEYAAGARSVLQVLQQKWGAENYNSYLQRSDIQFYYKWLSGYPLGKP